MPIKTGAKLDTLQALNIMASYLGIPPLANLSELPTEPDFVLAQGVLDDVTQTTLSQGLPCNTDFFYVLADLDPISGFTLIPDGALATTIIEDRRYTERDGLVYDTKERTFVTLTSLRAHIVWYQEFDALPELVKRYILTAASRSLVHRVKGDPGLSQMTIPDEHRTKIEFQRYVFNTGGVSLLDHADLHFITYRQNHYYRGY